MKLSKDFTLMEYLHSNKADILIKEKKIEYEDQYTVTKEQEDSLRALHTNIILPILNSVTEGHIEINSGYRCPEVNTAVGSKPTSQHLKCEAADIEYYNKQGKQYNKFIFDKAIELKLDFDQMLDEYRGSWAHLSYTTKKKNRRQFLKILK